MLRRELYATSLSSASIEGNLFPALLGFGRVKDVPGVSAAYDVGERISLSRLPSIEVMMSESILNS